MSSNRLYGFLNRCKRAVKATIPCGLSERHKSIGDTGEKLAVQYFKRAGWKILDRNYDRQVGEIDIIGQDQEGIVHFVEVKTVKDINPGRQLEPVERVGSQKRTRLKRVISIYVEEQGLYKRSIDWQFDIVEVTLEPFEIKVFENMIL